MPTPIRPIRLLHPWLQWSVGHVIAEPAQGFARDMVACKHAEWADEEPQNGYVHRMMEPIKRRRGRPRKEQ